MGRGVFASLMLAAFLAAVGLTMEAAADGHKHREREREHDRRGAVAPRNQLYTDHCGGCHLAYPPMLLPAGSWRQIMDGQASHYDQDLGLTPEVRAALTAYLTANAADNSGAKLARKIMRGMGSRAPLRITEVPYIIHKHQDDDVPAGAFQRKSVGSMANCGACHPGAAAGDFDDDDVRIPPE